MSPKKETRSYNVRQKVTSRLQAGTYHITWSISRQATSIKSNQPSIDNRIKLRLAIESINWLNSINSANRKREKMKTRLDSIDIHSTLKNFNQLRLNFDSLRLISNRIQMLFDRLWIFKEIFRPLNFPRSLSSLTSNAVKEKVRSSN